MGRGLKKKSGTAKACLTASARGTAASARGTAIGLTLGPGHPTENARAVKDGRLAHRNHRREARQRAGFVGGGGGDRGNACGASLGGDHIGWRDREVQFLLLIS